MIITVDIMYSSVDFEGNEQLREAIQTIMHTEMGVKVEGAFHSRAYKSGYWDGISDFYDMKEDRFHTGLLPQFLKGVRKLQESNPTLTYEIIDNRPNRLVDPESIDEEINVYSSDGGTITLRDYQYEAVKSAFEEKTGVLNLSTNSGKSITAIGFIQQILPYLKDNERVALFTHTRELFQQLSDNVKTSLGISDKELGTIGGGKFDIKGKQIVMVMIPTLNSALKDPKKGVKFTPKERVIKFIAEEVAPKFKKTVNTRELLRNYIKNCTLTTKVWESALEQLQYIAYDNQFTDKTAQMQLNKYIVEFDKIMEKKNKAKYKKYKETLDFLKSVRVMIPDESHHSKADTWFNNLSLCENADYRIGLTGTVDKKDEMGYQRLQALFTRVIAKVTNEQMIDQGVSSKPIIRVVPMVEPRDIEQVDNYLEAYRLGIVENDARNETIAKLAVGYKLRKPGGVLISVKEIDHGDRILEKLQDMNADVGFIHGNSDIEHRTNTLHKFAQGELDILIASTIIDEGVDMKSIGCMVLAAGGKSMRQQLQRIGRGLRLNGIDGNRVMVFDFEDKTNKFLLSHSKARKKIFKEEKFDVKNIGE